MKNGNGFSHKLEVFCGVCHEIKGSKLILVPANDGEMYDVNYKVTKAFTEIGRGNVVLDQFGFLMNVSVMSDKTCDIYMRKVYQDSKKIYKQNV